MIKKLIEYKEIDINYQATVDYESIFFDPNRGKQKQRCLERTHLLSEVVQKNDVAFCQFLLERKDIDTNSKNKQGETPFLLAVSRGYQDICLLFLRKEKDIIHQEDNLGNRALLIAVRNRELETVRFLLRQPGIDLNHRNTEQYSSLSYVFAEIGKGSMEGRKISQLLLQQTNIDVNSPIHRDGSTPIFWAILTQDVESVRLLLAHPEIDIKRQNESEQSPLSCAIKQAIKIVLNTTVIFDLRINSVEILKLLLDYQYESFSCSKFVIKNALNLIKYVPYGFRYRNGDEGNEQIDYAYRQIENMMTNGVISFQRIEDIKILMLWINRKINSWIESQTAIAGISYEAMCGVILLGSLLVSIVLYSRTLQ